MRDQLSQLKYGVANPSQLDEQTGQPKLTAAFADQDAAQAWIDDGADDDLKVFDVETGEPVAELEEAGDRVE